MRVAVLGTGIMGAGMARSLVRADHDVVVWNRTREKAEPLGKDGAGVADSVGAAVRGADAVVTMLFDVDATLEVCPELVGALGEQAVWVQSGTVGPEGQRRIAATAGETTAFLDVPVLGTRQPAEQGTLVVLAAGPHELVERMAPLFDAIGSKTVEVGGEIGQASALKLAANAWIGALTVGTAQSIALADALGVDPALFLAAIEGTASDSPYAQLKGKSMIAGDYPPAFALDGLKKDLGLMRDAARQTDFRADLLDTVWGLFDRASRDGHGSEDIAAVRHAFGAGKG